MVTCFGIALFPPFVELRIQPEFLPLMSKDRTRWPRCLLVAWLAYLGLSSRMFGSPWAVASSDLASSCLENAFGSNLFLIPPLPGIPFGIRMMFRIWLMTFLIIPISGLMVSREPIPHLDVEIAGAGAFIHSPAIVFDSHHWGHAQDLDDPHEGSSHIFSGIPGPIQSVQRAEYWGVILALQGLFWHSYWH